MDATRTACCSRLCAALLIIVAATLGQGCASSDSETGAKGISGAGASPAGQSAPAMTRAEAEKQLLETFARRDRTEYPSRDLVSQINMRDDGLEFRSSADGGVIVCEFRQLGKVELAPTFLTRVGQAKLSGCSREVSV